MNALDTLAREFVAALRPLQEALAEPGRFRSLLGGLGWRAVEIPAEWATLGTAIGEVEAAVGGLAADPDLEDLARVASAARALRDGIAGLTTAPSSEDPAALLDDVRGSLMSWLVIEHVARAAPRAFVLLRAIGVITRTVMTPAAARAPHVRYRLDLDRLARFVTEPSAWPAAVYAWGTELFDAGGVTELLFDGLIRLRLPAQLVQVDGVLPGYSGVGVGRYAIRVSLFDVEVEGAALQLGFHLAVLGPGAGGPCLVIAPWIPLLDGDGLSLGPHVVLRATAGDGRPIELALVVTPAGVDGRFPGNGGSLPDGGIGVSVEVATELRLGAAAGTRFELDGVKLGVFVDHDDAGFSANAELAVEGARLILAADDQDGIVGGLLGGRELRTSLPIALRWSSRDGFSFALAAGSLGVPSTVTLGPVRLDQTQLAFGANDGEIEAAITATVAVTLGPVTLQLDRLGGRVRLDRSVPGALGLGGLDANVILPTGGGLGIDADVVVGSGHVSRDPTTGGYTGALQLQLFGIGAAGVVVVDRKTPEGQDLMSCVALVAARFPGIPIGLGFTLQGLGGIFALNRTIDIDRARAATRSGGLAKLLSPSDPTHGMIGVLDRLRELFPSAAGRYIAGPSARIGWGSPATLVADIVVLAEAPAPIRIVMLGAATVGLPTIERMIVELHVDAIGVLDLARGTLALDASLHDSKVGPYALTGDMALRLSWGQQPDFAMALGGFHPAFKPPPGFPALRRLALALSTGDNPRLRMEAYLAITSNTVQVGARVELYIGVAGFALEGGLGFDTLIQLSPFRLLAEIRAHLALKRGRTTLMGLDIQVHLTGPAPWVLWGKAKFKLFIFSISIPFRATFGRAEDVPAIERQDVWSILHDNLAAPGNWSAQLPPETGQLVVVRAEAGEGEVLAHPLGTLTVSQNLVPLERTLGLFGSVPPKDHDQFAIVDAIGLDLAGKTTQYFAPAQFRQMSDAEKLASPSFERMVSGARLAPEAAIVFGHVQETPLDYEQSVILDVDQPASERLDARYTPAGRTVAALAEHGPAGIAEVRRQGRKRFAPAAPGPSVAEPVFALATRDELTRKEPEALDGSYTAVAERLRRRADRRALQIVRAEELELT